MRSSTGQYFVGLDHVRAVAAFMVFAWHFIHVGNGHYAGPPVFPLSLLTEGHTGVALFMTLSGYLFAKLLDGRRISFRWFLWNRFLRLAPLLVLVVLFVGLQHWIAGDDLLAWAKRMLAGIALPTLPNGGWSITAEFHFYLLLPLLLLLSRRWTFSLLLIVLVALALRALLHQGLGEVQTAAYWTIVGRIDQFVLGILGFQLGRWIAGRHVLMLAAALAFGLFYFIFDARGGFYLSPSYPSPSPIWIYLSTVEGAFYGLAIAWYDGSFAPTRGSASRFVAQIGAYSYSIYLLHFFVVFKLSGWIDRHLFDLSDVHLALLIAAPSFLVMVPIGHLSYRYVEAPFLSFRRRYLISS